MRAQVKFIVYDKVEHEDRRGVVRVVKLTQPYPKGELYPYSSKRQVGRQTHAAL